MNSIVEREQNQHSKLYRFFFKKFNSKKNKINTAKYAKLENSPQPENIQASANLNEEELASSSSNPRTLVNKLNNNLYNNVNRLLNPNNNKQKQQKPTVINFNTHDGVFSNLNEKPEVRSTRLPVSIKQKNDIKIIYIYSIDKYTYEIYTLIIIIL